MSVTTTTADVTVEVHLDDHARLASLRGDARGGLSRSPKELSPTWLYDERGCRLFESITRLPEYYPARAELAVLGAHAADTARLSGADTLVELGSGTSEKTRLLLDAMYRTGPLKRFVPFDVAEPTLRAAASAIAGEYPGLRVAAVVGDFHRHLHFLPPGGRRLIAFLGGTIGNLPPAERRAFLVALSHTMAPGDSLLLGTDLVKDTARLVAAYDDAAGVTAAFNKNVLVVLNRELGADFDVDRFHHIARFDHDHEWIEMRLRSRAPQVVRLPAINLTVRFDDGEDLRTEISAKFRPDRVRTELTGAGFTPVAWWTDPAGDYAVSLSVR